MNAMAHATQIPTGANLEKFYVHVQRVTYFQKVHIYWLIKRRNVVSEYTTVHWLFLRVCGFHRSQFFQNPHLLPLSPFYLFLPLPSRSPFAIFFSSLIRTQERGKTYKNSVRELSSVFGLPDAKSCDFTISGAVYIRMYTIQPSAISSLAHLFVVLSIKPSAQTWKSLSYWH